MQFSPIQSSEVITSKYKRYLRTIFKIKDPDYEKQFLTELDKKSLLAKGPYLDVVDSFKKGKSLRALIEEGIVPKNMEKLNFPLDRPMYLHQETSIRRCAQGQNVVVSTGTGSGKTESFLMPILASLAREDMAGTLNPGVRALLIYPMNALANDQMDRLRQLLEHYPEITFGSYTGETKQKQVDAERQYEILNKRKPLKNEMISREEMIKQPPHILITNYAMLEYLMVRPRENGLFGGQYAGNWRFVVLDEAHVYKGSTGIEVSMLLRRLHSSLPVQKMQYILTSATLGGEDQNNEVADFASRLCDAPFYPENIIRAIRENPKENADNLIDRSFDSYHNLAEQIQILDIAAIREEIKKITGHAIPQTLTEDDLHAIVYDMTLKDSNYWNVRKLLQEKPQTVAFLAEKLGCSEKQIEDFVTVAAFGIKNGAQLFDAKYHMFIRATDSAFITLAPSKKLMLTRHKTIQDKGQEYAVFEMAVCRSCHSIYLMGRAMDNGYFVQSNMDSDTKYGKDVVLYLGDDYKESDDEDEADNKVKAEKCRICPHCGKLMPFDAGSVDQCEHNPNDYVTVYRVNKSSSELKHCIACDNSVTTGSMIRPFFTGQEAVTSVLGTALFEELPSRKVIPQKITVIHENDDFDDFDDFDQSIDKKKSLDTVENSAKQFIAFSDNRQAAAFYASYLGETYQSILYKRLILEALKTYYSDISVTAFVNELQALFEKYQILSDPADSYQKEAWKAILAEMVDNYSERSLQNLGFYEFTIPDNIVSGASKWGLSAEDVKNIINVFIMTMMKDAAIKYPVNLNQQDKEFFTYNGHEGGFTLSDKGTYQSSFLPTKHRGMNKRMEFLKKVAIASAPGFAALSDEEQWTKLRNFMQSFWEKFMVGKEVVSSEGTLFKVNTGILRIRPKAKVYQCPKCKKITPYNVHGICPTYRCDGTLQEINLKEIMKDDHYYRMFQDLEIRKLRVVEHTAQLNKEKAYQYQNDFKEKKIDVLSCSTTFELGVDVGSLETVFMRNMPPSPANYAQRAGRAGRSIKSVAYALTFCNRGNHDFAYFKEPESMIRGRINPPVFKVENEKIAIRHVFASAFAFFWKVNPDYFADVKTFLDDNGGVCGADEFIKYLKGEPHNLEAFLEKFLPVELVDRYDVKHYGWLPMLIGEDGAFTKARAEYNDEVSLLEKAKAEAYAGNGGRVDYIQFRINTFKNENILTFLSRKNVFPKYGFPVDTVELSVWDSKKGNKLNLDLSRDLSMALSEYAPGSQIVADGNLITSRYIKKVPNMAWKTYDYIYCDECQTLNIDQHIDFDDPDHLVKCKACGAELDRNKKGTFIVPEFGFEAGTIKKATLMKPKRTFSSDTAYVGYRDDIETKSFSEGNRKYEMVFSQNDEMAVLNRSNFYVCRDCGYTVVKSMGFRHSMMEEHKRSNGSTCSNKVLEKYALGYRFRTDIIQIRFLWPELRKFYPALSVMYGLIRGTCACLGIEQSDIAGTLRYFTNDVTKKGSFMIILYDNTPGGAGHVKRLYDEKVFKNVLKKTYEIMTQCTCGGDRTDTSCYNCLRSYSNQRYHDFLQRGYVIDFLKNIFDEQYPAYEQTDKSDEKSTVVELQGLTGWAEVEALLQYSDEDVNEFAEKAKDHEFDPPIVDYEVMDGIKVIGSLELAWPEQKVGYITDEQIDIRDALEEAGWQIFDKNSEFDETVWK